LETRISSLARPVSVTRFTKGNIAVRVIFAKRMLLTPGYVLRPVTSVCFLVVQQPSDTELLGGGPVPACPVTGAGRLVPEYSIQPVAMFSTLRWVSFLSVLAADIVRVVTQANQTKPPIVVVDKTIRTGRNEPLAFVALIVKIARGLVSDCFCP